eukprot:CAMPEP_0194525102 /NCGR_PEP_ID=MMETSP0253-20130528/60447_1 /TAXON_ID=2966 /ORGANISM="Noctiluca scintillans" /LENGTH=260 /DNA_ID=CAMNT_0039369795 /DNA_START=8 /DNA_END=790 /DNA_ORIENTATION=-
MSLGVPLGGGFVGPAPAVYDSSRAGNFTSTLHPQVTTVAAPSISTAYSGAAPGFIVGSIVPSGMVAPAPVTTSVTTAVAAPLPRGFVAPAPAVYAAPAPALTMAPSVRAPVSGFPRHGAPDSKDLLSMGTLVSERNISREEMAASGRLDEAVGGPLDPPFGSPNLGSRAAVSGVSGLPRNGISVSGGISRSVGLNGSAINGVLQGVGSDSRPRVASGGSNESANSGFSSQTSPVLYDAGFQQFSSGGGAAKVLGGGIGGY